MAASLLSVLGVFAGFERALIRERQLEGIALAEARGACTGRKPALTPGQAELLRIRAAAGESKTAVARGFGISRQTLYRYLALPSSASPYAAGLSNLSPDSDLRAGPPAARPVL